MIRATAPTMIAAHGVSRNVLGEASSRGGRGATRIVPRRALRGSFAAVRHGVETWARTVEPVGIG